ncbi:hypothetical protein RRG08_049167 [Elysia crispata]|uniref:Uncharacterized protein n=1 Tax=Elysia crispata TaxID=231223 RepID=A0AAE1ARC5_9GAST|nr:hypothetical protein RRG08_049167 [Elysia crispata]
MDWTRAAPFLQSQSMGSTADDHCGRWPCWSQTCSSCTSSFLVFDSRTTFSFASSCLESRNRRLQRADIVLSYDYMFEGSACNRTCRSWTTLHMSQPQWARQCVSRDTRMRATT